MDIVIVNGSHGCISEGWVREGGEFAWDRLWGDGYVEMRRGSEIWVWCNGVVIAQLGAKLPRLGVLSFHQLINMLAA